MLATVRKCAPGEGRDLGSCAQCWHSGRHRKTQCYPSCISKCGAVPRAGKKQRSVEEGRLLRKLVRAEDDSDEVKSIDELIEDLCTSADKEVDLGDGLWVVRYFRGLAAWQFWSATGRLVRGDNRAGQAFDDVACTVLNYAELAGPRVYVRATGTYELQDAEERLFQATVTQAAVHWNDRRIALPFIRGKGQFRVKYAGTSLRIFENPGSALAVQVRADLL